MKKFYLIAFDISNDKIRRKVVKILEKKAIRVQKSVFETMINDKEYIRMKTKIDNLIDTKTDSVRYYFLCKSCVKNIDVTGSNLFIQDEDIVIV